MYLCNQAVGTVQGSKSDRNSPRTAPPTLTLSSATTRKRSHWTIEPCHGSFVVYSFDSQNPSFTIDKSVVSHRCDRGNLTLAFLHLASDSPLYCNIPHPSVLLSVCTYILKSLSLSLLLSISDLILAMAHPGV